MRGLAIVVSVGGVKCKMEWRREIRGVETVWKVELVKY